MWHVNELFPKVDVQLRSGLDVTLQQPPIFHISKSCFRSDHIVWLLLPVHHIKLHKYSYSDMRQSSV